MQPARTFGTRELGEPWSLDNNERDWRAIARVLCSSIRAGGLGMDSHRTSSQTGPAGDADDWSHRHLIFSQPSTDAQAAAVMNDPRYWQQFNRLHFVKTLNASESGFSGPGLFAGAATSHGDWAQNLGTGECAPANLVQIAIASASSASQPSSAIA